MNIKTIFSLLQFVLNPTAVLFVVSIFGYRFLGNPLMLEKVATNVYRPSTVGAFLVFIMVILISVTELWLWTKNLSKPMRIPEYVSFGVIPANLIAAALLWIWIKHGLEGNLIAFAVIPVLSLASALWIYFVKRAF